ncbi:MAG: glycoside hydrolase family 65 protein [Bacteroidetes bacterium]|nr:glycoside hydrolase family 65 protein [Bacteroidota bacterium]
MNEYLKHDEWKIVEEGFHSEKTRASESIFSLGNGMMGQRANFEETYSGETLQGTYVAGIYYPDKTRVGWWKNGYPEYFAKVLNSAFWIGINVSVDGEVLDLATCSVRDFRRELNMKKGLLLRQFIATLPNGVELKVSAKRFLSIVSPEIGAIQYSITSLNRDVKVEMNSYIDGDVINEDSNYNEKFWDEVQKESNPFEGFLQMKTKKLDFQVGWRMFCSLKSGGDNIQTDSVETTEDEKYFGTVVSFSLAKGVEASFYKYVAVVSNMNHVSTALKNASKTVLSTAVAKGFDQLLADHVAAWARKWEHGDIIIEGDVAAQQAIRFNIFQLHQTYSGEDDRLNIGPKGFTGEKYGGCTYWDTEAYCIPFYMVTAGSEVARKLLLYRYKQLDKAIENGVKLGFTNGAALYPMVTMNGEECHNEWEITFEEIHRNGAIAYAIYNYARYTGDYTYINEYGLDVLLGIARFWAQRVSFSETRQQYVMLGVTGPNEYENNANNNWYTSYIARWCMQYTMEQVARVKDEFPEKYTSFVARTHLNEGLEFTLWSDICNRIFLPEDKKKGVFLQQEGYLDKEQILVKDLTSNQRPLNQKWSWDRILRSCFIKQADVLQGIYFFEDDFDLNTIKRNFEFYEARTVHESSLSPCVHSILAAKIGDIDQAYNMYLRTARLDLDDYNREVKEGLHITSMAGTWLSIVEGFGGMRIKKDMLSFNPLIPNTWNAYSFKICFRDRVILIRVEKDKVIITIEEGETLDILLVGKKYHLKKSPLVVKL